ncbi:MAG TPA: hypothetical protein VEB66_13515 [Opitutaceae bacterium]|nr:hypothetical protein [Opitutaceae bacterium]
MTNQDSDGLFDGEWEDRGELTWNEADWERYLADQEKAVRDYLAAYEAAGQAPDRIDQVARQLGWESAEEAGAEEPEVEPLETEEEFPDDWEPYTLHRNPVYVATKALYLTLIARWEQACARIPGLPAPVALGLIGTLHRGEDAALHGIHALEMGDYTLAICFFKRALRELNASMAALADLAGRPELAGFRAFATPRLFDLREIWLRVMNECRVESDADDSE